ncbi:MAG: hypothetical protein HFE39_06610 [Clostridiales bacterium]|jgi:hypothetical protein|nr:hypothetical protein [Clostridiales bacterium]
MKDTILHEAVDTFRKLSPKNQEYLLSLVKETDTSIKKAYNENEKNINRKK